VAEMVALHRLPPGEERTKAITNKVHSISKFLPEPVKVMEYVKKLSQHMATDEMMLKLMEKITEPDISCKDSYDATSMILKKMGSPIMTNLYYNTIKQLLERISSVMIDREAVQILVRLVEDALNDGEILEELGLNSETAGERGLRLLFVLSFVFPSHFVYRDVIHALLSLMKNPRDCVAPLVLSILSFVGKHKPISEQFPQLQEVLANICLQFVKLGTKKQAKQAVKCMFLNTKENQDAVFTTLLDAIKENLNGSKNRMYMTAIVALGHLAFYLPDKFPVQVKNLVSRKIVKELVMKDVTPARGGTEEWCSEEDLCLETQCKMEGMKVQATGFFSIVATCYLLTAIRNGKIL
jgi:sister-chromatid-cohesion protein PDS5